MRHVGICAALFALAACNGTNLENKGQELGAKADEAVADVNNAADNIGENLENLADRADTTVANAADSVDRQVEKVENAAEAAERELER